MNPLEAILNQYWGYASFRPVQEEAIRSVLASRDTLVLLPTGGGKSVCFQVPTLASEGVCIVVTPLIALMKDQVEQLRRRNIPAAAIHAGLNRHEIDIALDNCIHGHTRFLYVSPERLRTEIMRERTKQMKVCLLAVDEAHCISAWGYDFRPAYLLIAEFRTLLPGVPIMALTATATAEVEADILEKLEMKRPQVFRQSFARANLSYSTFKEESKERKLYQILTKVPGTAIVYVRTRKRTQQVADWLNNQGIRAAYYHAGLSFRDRSERQTAWLRNQVRVMVATNAFGMGIDKPDVRVVVHLDLPNTLEAYYQEAGRAGRDGRKAYAVALYNTKDTEDLLGSIERKYPPVELVRRVYQSLANYYKVPIGGGELASFDLDVHAFTGTFGLPLSETHYAFKLLENEGFIQLSEDYYSPSKLHLLIDNRQLYDFQLRYPDYDAFIKLLLRMYGGELFTEYVRISEIEVGQTYYVSTKEVQQRLRFMAERSIADYQPPRDKPQITFLTPRFDAEQLPLNVYAISQKKQQDQQKAEAVIHYAQHEQQCRTILLLNYFNERDGQPCGQCDVCLRRRKATSPEQNVEADLEQRLLLRLQQGPLSPRALSKAFEQVPETQVVAALRQLVEQERVRYDDRGHIILNPHFQA